MRHVAVVFACIAGTLFLAGPARGAEGIPDGGASAHAEGLIQVFRDAGATAWASKARVGRLLPEAHIAFDAKGHAVAAGAVQKAKLYDHVTFIMAVRLKDNACVVERAFVPDIENVKDEAKRKKLSDALAACAGRVVKTLDQKGNPAADPPAKTDAVTGATHIQKEILKRLEETGQALADLLVRPPDDWPRRDLPRAPEAP